jgi:hypothetical protein
MRAQLQGFSDWAAAQTAAYRVVANASVAALPLIGIVSTAETVSCFVEVPWNLVRADPKPATRTVLRVTGCPELVLSLSDLVAGGGQIGFLLTNQPLWLAGGEYQPGDADEAIAVVQDVMQAAGVHSIGPIRCRRCNHPVPPERARILGTTTCLCIRCQLTEERGQ